MEYIRQIYQDNPGLKHTEDEIAYLKGGALEGMQNVRKIAPEANAEIRRIMADTTVFCVSETNDSILMWSHYAANHTGVVVKFLAVSDLDSPLILARPVRYSKEIPRLSYEIMLDGEKGRMAILDTLTLSKSGVWAYEKEWRVWSTLRDKTLTYEIIPYSPGEIGAVYLGCKIDKHDKDEIIEITRKKYPLAKIFQAGKHSKEYALVFRELT
jgi:hypothetical protein